MYCTCPYEVMNAIVRDTCGKKYKKEIDRKQINYCIDKNRAFQKHTYQSMENEVSERFWFVSLEREEREREEAVNNNNNKTCMHKTTTTTTLLCPQ